MGWLIGTILAGLIFGALARLILPGKQGVGILGTIAAGVAGSFIGFVIAVLVPFFDHRGFSGLIFNVAGAVLVLAGAERLALSRGRTR